MSIKVLLVDDQKLIRDGIKALLALSDAVTVIGECADGSEVPGRVENAQQTPDLILMDLSMPKMDGLAAMAALKANGSKIPVLVLTTFDDSELVIKSLQQGAKGFLLKDVSLETLVDAIKAVSQGKNFYLPSVTENLLKSQPVASEFQALPSLEELTVKEREVLRLMAAGLSNKEIADALFKSEGTIKNQVSNLLSKLGVRDRTRAVLLALERGLLAADSQLNKKKV